MTYYSVALPDVEDDVVNFSFSSSIDGASFKFNFRWFTTRWFLAVTLPSEEVRNAGVYPNAPSWTGYPDYTVEVQTGKSEILYADLATCALIVGVV